MHSDFHLPELHRVPIAGAVGQPRKVREAVHAAGRGFAVDGREPIPGVPSGVCGGLCCAGVARRVGGVVNARGGCTRCMGIRFGLQGVASEGVMGDRRGYFKLIGGGGRGRLRQFLGCWGRRGAAKALGIHSRRLFRR